MRRPGTPQTRRHDPDDLLMVGLLAVMAWITFLEVMARFLFRAPLAQVGEIVPSLFVWMTFLGIAVAEKRGAHLGLSLFSAASPGLRRALGGIRVAAVALFFGILCIYGARVCYDTFRRGEMTPFGWPAWIFSLSVPAGALIILVRQAARRMHRDSP